MEQVVENLGEEVSERHAFATAGRTAGKAQADDETGTEFDQDDAMMSQIQQIKWEWSGVVRRSGLEPLLGYCSLKDFCQRLCSVGTDEKKVLEKSVWVVCSNQVAFGGLAKSWIGLIDIAFFVRVSG